MLFFREVMLKEAQMPDYLTNFADAMLTVFVSVCVCVCVCLSVCLSVCLFGIVWYAVWRWWCVHVSVYHMAIIENWLKSIFN